MPMSCSYKYFLDTAPAGAPSIQGSTVGQYLSYCAWRPRPIPDPQQSGFYLHHSRAGCAARRLYHGHIIADLGPRHFHMRSCTAYVLYSVIYQLPCGQLAILSIVVTSLQHSPILMLDKRKSLVCSVSFNCFINLTAHNLWVNCLSVSAFNQINTT